MLEDAARGVYLLGSSAGSGPEGVGSPLAAASAAASLLASMALPTVRGVGPEGPAGAGSSSELGAEVRVGACLDADGVSDALSVARGVWLGMGVGVGVEGVPAGAGVEVAADAVLEAAVLSEALACALSAASCNRLHQRVSCYWSKSNITKSECTFQADNQSFSHLERHLTKKKPMPAQGSRPFCHAFLQRSI